MAGESNFKKIKGSMFLVRTQAGFKSAIRQFIAEQGYSVEILDYAHDYPTTYPSVVSFSIGSYGYDRLIVNHIHVNALLAALDGA